MSSPLNLGFQRPANCALHDAVLVAHQEGLDAGGYVRHTWRCEFGCAILLTDEEEARWGWQFFNKTSQLLRVEREQKPREQRLYSAEDIIEMLKAEGLEVVEKETGAQSLFGDDGPVTRITLRKKLPQ
jgi:hypothetical protein